MQHAHPRTRAPKSPALPANHPSIILPLLAFCVASLAALLAYRLGLPGDFLFDDYPNLKLLGSNGGVHDLATLQLYLSDSFAGPTGRPVAMLSFLLDARTWPADPLSFKLTNIWIHAINGLLLFKALYLGLLQAKIDASDRQLAWIAAIAAAWWLLTPYHVSTVLYVIQRMAELSTTFVLAGIIAYLIGRKQLAHSPRNAYLLLSIAVPAATLLAALSKENGALLPLLLLALEFTLLSRDPAGRPSYWWTNLFLTLPSIIIIAWILNQGLSPNTVISALRGFTNDQRLLTESRILLEYLWYLLIPHTSTPGIFRDNIAISTSLFQPLSTLFSVITLAGLAAIAFLARTRQPLLSAAIAFFFAGHVLESSYLALELSFEHRNYLPSLLLYLPLSQALAWLHHRSPTASILGGALVFTILTLSLAARADLWSNRSNMYQVWATTNPDSPRAQISYTNILETTGRGPQALRYLTHASGTLPDNLLLKLHLLRLQSHSPTGIQKPDLDQALRLAASADFSHEAILAAIALTDDYLAKTTSGIRSNELMDIWQALSANSNPAYLHSTGAQISHQRGRLYLNKNNIESALAQFNQALQQSNRPETALKQAAILATHKYYCQAITHLDSIPLSALHAKTNPRSSTYYQEEIAYLRQNIVNNSSDNCRNIQNPTEKTHTTGL